MLTLSAATAYKLLQSGSEMLDSLGLNTILLGILIAYFSAWIAVKTMVAYLKKHGLGIFGIYRILLALLTFLLLSLGTLNA
jgi:undecaprenyl-diphosphatase